MAPKSLLSMTSNFVAVVSVLLPICGQICQGMQNICIFVEEVVQCLGTMTEKVSEHLSVVGI